VPLALNVVAFFVFVAALALMDGEQTSFEAGLPFFVAFMLTVVASAPALFIFQADIERNASLSAQERERWLSFAHRLPHALVVYWWRYGRPSSSR
jgi:hypothetical protein